MKTIDLKTWPRAVHYNFFRRMDYPQYLICSNVDITHFLNMTKEKCLPFFYSMIYAAMLAINRTEEFRYRIRGDSVVLHDVVHPSFTAMSPGSDLFKMVTTDMTDDIESFVSTARAKSDWQTDCFVREDVEGRDDLVYITAIPWVSFTNISHTISFNKDDSVPRLAIGKYFEDSGRTLIPFSVQAHHSFVDGIHMGRYYDCLQEHLNSFQR